MCFQVSLFILMERRLARNLKLIALGAVVFDDGLESPWFICYDDPGSRPSSSNQFSTIYLRCSFFPRKHNLSTIRIYLLSFCYLCDITTFSSKSQFLADQQPCRYFVYQKMLRDFSGNFTFSARLGIYDLYRNFFDS